MRAARRGTPAVAAGAVLASVVLIVAEFTRLYSLHEVTSDIPAGSMSTGAHDSYALIPIALLAAGLGLALVGGRRVSRAAPAALAALGVLTLVIALVGDLPDAHAHGLTRHYVLAATTPGLGLYLETLGGCVLLLSGGIALVAAGGGLGPLRGSRRERAASPLGGGPPNPASRPLRGRRSES